MKKGVFSATFIVAHLVAITLADPGWRNYLHRGPRYTPYSPYGSLWRGGRALNSFPFRQQASLPRPTSQPFRAESHPETESSHQARAPHARRDAQDTHHDFNFSQLNSRQQSSGQTFHGSTSHGTKSALEIHAQQLRNHEATLQAQLTLMGIGQQKPATNNHIHQSHNQINSNHNLVIKDLPRRTNQVFPAATRPILQPNRVVQEAVINNQPVKTVPDLYKNSIVQPYQPVQQHTQTEPVHYNEQVFHNPSVHELEKTQHSYEAINTPVHHQEVKQDHHYQIAPPKPTPPGACPPVVPGLNCGYEESECWSPGVPDLDCPGSALCCFNGCINVCILEHHQEVKTDHYHIAPPKPTTPAYPKPPVIPAPKHYEPYPKKPSIFDHPPITAPPSFIPPQPLKPYTEPQNSCPPVSSNPQCTYENSQEQCWAQEDCPENGLCCFNGCANVCIPVHTAPLEVSYHHEPHQSAHTYEAHPTVEPVHSYAPLPAPVPAPVHSYAPAPLPLPEPVHSYASAPAPVPVPVPAPVHSYAPAPVPVPEPVHSYAPAPAPVPTPHTPPGTCPPVLPGLKCGYEESECWSPGVRDLDCPGSSLCCFNGCINVCVPAHNKGPVIGPVAPQNEFIHFTPDVVESHVVHDSHVVEEKCVDKVEYVEEYVQDEEIKCHHSYEKKCQTSFTTDFESVQEEECDETFQKDCFIEYKKVAIKDTVQVCHTPLVKDCNLPGPVECKTEYETMCETRYHEHRVVDDVPNCQTIKEYKCELVTKGYTKEEECKEWPVQKCTVTSELVKKVTPETSCHKEPKELCTPSGCGFVQAPEECYDKKETTIQDVPEETCSLTPKKQCKHVTRLVPNLKPVEDCVDVPKEICSKQQSPPRKVKKPVTKKWCYTPEPHH